LTNEEIHNLYLHMSGRAEGLAEATGSADFPVLFANAILEYAKRPWVGLTEEQKQTAIWTDGTFGAGALWAETKIKENT
jgi:hypothetical protein